MALFKAFLSLTLATSSLLGIDKTLIPYLIQSKELDASFELYRSYKKELGRHDFEVLEKIGLTLLNEGIHSNDPEVQLLSLYGAGIAALTSTLDILEAGIKSSNPETQMVSLQLLSRIPDDRSDEILSKAMSSPFLMARMEAGYHLALRKHRKATGQIESLMQRIPHEFWVYFPQFFALIGTKEAITILKHLMEDPYASVRTQAILSAAQLGRDDLLPKIRAHATHHIPAEQEACAVAIGALSDSSSRPILKRLLVSSELSVRLSAAKALYLLGETEALEVVEEAAKASHLLAIALLGEFSQGQEVLVSFLKSDNIQLRINSAISLLKMRDSRALNVIQEILIKDQRDLAFIPQFSVGGSFYYWKVIASTLQKAPKEVLGDLRGISLHLRETLLSYCLELPEEDFLKVAENIFKTKQTDLVPHLVSLLENHRTEGALALLKKESMTAGSPLARAYCNLSLYRARAPGPYEERVYNWVLHLKKEELIRFRPSRNLPSTLRETTSYELTPEESSRLLIETYETLSDRHDEKSIELLLEAMQKGHPQNRYVLAGLLLRALQ